MSRTALLLALLLAASGVAAQDASIIPDDAPEWKPIETAVAEAKTGEKTLLLHGYAAWCGWCGRLDTDVYTDDTIQAYLDANFEVARLDIENREPIEFFDYRLPTAWLASGLGITSTPTTIFMDPQTGEVITRLPGYADAETFLFALRYVREGAYEDGSFQDFMDRENGVTPDTSGDDMTDEDATAPLVPVAN